MSDNVFNIKKSKKKELGVELELEGYENNFYIHDHLPNKLKQKYIFDQVKDDSVEGEGIEIIFNHFHLRHWIPREINKIYKTISLFNLYSGKTAGMHISYSGPNISAVYDIFKREYDFLDKNREVGFVGNLFQTISARSGYFNGAFVYGTDYDVFEIATKDDKILEVRAFESTMDPTIFYYRLCITQYILNYASKNNYSTLAENLFNDMPKAIKYIFWYLTITKNPNKYGFKREFIYEKLFGQQIQKNLQNTL